MTSKPKSIELKEKGNKCLSSGSYAEAMLHYSHAIKLDETNPQIYSNRSLAFLKLQQFYYAIEDAKETIRLANDWYKGYYRKAEVEAECGHYEEAVRSYHLALQFLDKSNGNDSNKHELVINNAIKKAISNLQKQIGYDYQIPWIGAALGLVAGMALITWDYVTNYAMPFIRHPILKLFIIGLVSALFFYLAKLQRNYTKSYRESLLKPPIDLFDQ